MGARLVSPALMQFIDDELLRAPLLFDQVVEGAVDQVRKALPSSSPLQRSVLADLVQALQAHKPRLCDRFMRSLRDQVDAELHRDTPRTTMPKAGGAPLKLSLVDEDEVALDVELSHTIEAINSIAEYELRELQTFVSAMVGDMDVATDHNPFRADTWARAVWAAAQAVPLSRGHQVAFMRHAGTPLAQLLRRSYAASTSRLEGMGIEPAAYRTLILPSGSRRGRRAGETTFSPDLHRIRETMPAPSELPLGYQGQQPGGSPAARTERWVDVAAAATNRGDRQAVELVSRLFDAMMDDERVPDDVKHVILRLHGPAMRLTLRDGSMLDQDKHPLWRFINRVVFEAEMAPDPADPERALLLKNAHATVEQLAAEPEQNTGLYRWALDRLESFLHKRLTRRLSGAASQIGALQKLEDKLSAGQAPPSSFHGMLDVPQLDTVPAELMPEAAPAAPTDTTADAWLESLRPGDWVRVFLQGHWVRARVLWPGERREVWLFGDGASDVTWAVRRGALVLLHGQRLAKTLRQRSIVGSAALRVQEKMGDRSAA